METVEKITLNVQRRKGGCRVPICNTNETIRPLTSDSVKTVHGGNIIRAHKNDNIYFETSLFPNV